MKHNSGLHRFAVLLAASTLVLIFIGGLVTSTDSGLAVPDWPLSYGMLFPPMVGGVLFEHGHRMAAATVGFLTVILAIWLLKTEPRRWVRILGGLALLAVVCQGVLGGITVLFLLPTAVSVSHAGLAEIFFCLTVTLALVTSRGWQEANPHIEDAGSPALKVLASTTTLVIYVQILIGALMRHTASGLAIPDFPLAYGHWFPPYVTRQIMVNYAHRVGALIVAVCILWLCVRIFWQQHPDKALLRPAAVLLGALLTQILLGAETVWSAKATVPTTLHVMVGAFTLASSLVLTLTTHRVLLVRPKPNAVPLTRPSTAME